MANIEKKFITVQQTASCIRKPKKQKYVLIGLGLNKMHSFSTLEDTSSVRGMIRKVSHLVRIVDKPEFASGRKSNES